MTIHLVYMTAGSLQEAENIGAKLVSSRLAACVNIIGGMQSLYWWDGEVQKDKEIVIIAKTSAEKVPLLVDMVKGLHSYDCPCVVAVPVSGGYQPFLDWIMAETGKAPAD